MCKGILKAHAAKIDYISSIKLLVIMNSALSIR